MQPIIEVKNLSKKYNIVHRSKSSYVALRDIASLAFFHPVKLFKKKTKNEKREDFLALKGINFSVNKGDVVGIIGHNGAGKSTLLKIISRITHPDEGEIIIQGSIGSLLEVGTGFNPELSGRENIFLNGVILGMTRREIEKKFDAIVDFAGIEKFIDTPVKHYSSGMYVRLAFSVAAHFEPSILLIDEVLAVGDAEFQKKCLGKMEEVTRQAGRTILFVSHNLSAIANICNKVMVLERGQVKFFGEVNEGIDTYMNLIAAGRKDIFIDENLHHFGPSRFCRFTNLQILDELDRPIEYIKIGGEIKVKIAFTLKEDVDNLEIGFIVKNLSDATLYTFIGEWEGLKTRFNKGNHEIVCEISNFNCFPGFYGITPWLKRKNEGIDQQIENVVRIQVFSDNINGHNPNLEIYSHMGVYQKSNWYQL